MLTIQFPYPVYILSPGRPFWFRGRLVLVVRGRAGEWWRLLAITPSGGPQQTLPVKYGVRDNYDDYGRHVLVLGRHTDSPVVVLGPFDSRLRFMAYALSEGESGILKVKKVISEEEKRQLLLRPKECNTTEPRNGDLLVVRRSGITESTTALLAEDFAARLLAARAVADDDCVFIVNALAQTVKVLKLDHPALVSGVNPDRLVAWACGTRHLTFFDLEP